MPDPFPIIDVLPSRRILGEPMGTKRKFWWSDDADQRWLFKYSRPGTGEHWAEKIAAELGSALGIPCAHVQLAVCEGEPGCSVRAFPARGVRAALVHGNELLQTVDATYPMTQLRGVSKHTVGAVLDVLDGVSAPLEAAALGLADAPDWFVGYLLLDAFIGNGDRHHENWGVLQPYELDVRRSLAPSYDHASSLGRELLDPQRVARLAGRDPRNTVETYVRRARSAFYGDANDAIPLDPGGAFRLAERIRPTAAAMWLAQLGALGQNEVESIVNAVPSSLMSEASRSFAIAALRTTRSALLGGPS